MSMFIAQLATACACLSLTSGNHHTCDAENSQEPSGICSRAAEECRKREEEKAAKQARLRAEYDGGPTFLAWHRLGFFGENIDFLSFTSTTANPPKPGGRSAQREFARLATDMVRTAKKAQDAETAVLAEHKRAKFDSVQDVAKELIASMKKTRQGICSGARTPTLCKQMSAR
eukprot:4498043-Pleurochrysis_carterae.AAC.2